MLCAHVAPRPLLAQLINVDIMTWRHSRQPIRLQLGHVCA